jgi:2-succinyl-6-hydroxy-2,4-cyclohexadiene-1-carboxylate synthase
VRETLVLLHGFAGTRHTWDGVLERMGPEGYLPLALDLPGHGEAADVESPLTLESCVEYVLARCPERFALAGYSLGGRIALRVALEAPERVARLVLVSTTAGIGDAAERAARRRADRRLADELETGRYEDFIERWRTQPLFAEDPPAVGALAREDHRRNRPAALAGALRGLGTGEMQPLWDSLGALTMPVIVVVGERDQKFRALGERLAGLIAGSRLIVVPGGHALALENPAALAEVFGETAAFDRGHR